MKTLIVNEIDSNKRIDRYIISQFKSLPFPALQKAFRKKDIKVNSIRIKQDYVVKTGDNIEIYIADEFFNSTSPTPGNISKYGFEPIFEDENIIIVNKEQGIPVHQDKDQTSDTLIDNVRKYLKENGENIANSHFQASLCHRLDRNTGGLVIIAKNQESLDYMLEKLETHEIKKLYQCLVNGKMEKQNTQLKAWLFKDESKSKVYINSNKSPGALEIITKYKVLDYYPDIDVSKLEIELVTGRTHQIRAHLAFVGHPVIGDGKYGSNAVNRPLKAKYQELWACSLEFKFTTPGKLYYLKDKQIRVEPDFKVLRKKAN